MIHKQNTAISMPTTPYTTNTNTNVIAPVAAADDCDCCTTYATSADLCAPYITLEEARNERQQEERNEQRRAEWGDRLKNAALRANKRARVAEKEEINEAVRVAAMHARDVSTLAMWFEPALERDVKQQTRQVPGKRARERAAERAACAAQLAQHWKKCLPAHDRRGHPSVLGDAVVPATLGGG
jgi:hypothetical protein